MNEYNRIPYGIELVIKGLREDANLEGLCPDCNVLLMDIIIFLVKWKYAPVVVINSSHVVVE